MNWTLTAHHVQNLNYSAFIQPERLSMTYNYNDSSCTEPYWHNMYITLTTHHVQNLNDSSCTEPQRLIMYGTSTTQHLYNLNDSAWHTTLTTHHVQNLNWHNMYTTLRTHHVQNLNDSSDSYSHIKHVVKVDSIGYLQMCWNKLRNMPSLYSAIVLNNFLGNCPNI